MYINFKLMFDKMDMLITYDFYNV